MNACEVVDGLMKMHAYEGLWCDGMVSPAKIPVDLLRLIDDFESKFECNFPDDGVIGNWVR